jgi:predicted enzyme related to lactoylglutathione lyase
MTTARTYPAGVTSWVDLEVTDLAALDVATEFYGGLFGWTFDQATPDGAPFRYLVARLDGRDAAGLGGPAPADRPGDTEWTTYVAVDDADATAAAVERAGGRVLRLPADAGEGGRSVLCADPEGLRFGLFQARRRLGAQVTNQPGAWNFSDLHTADPEGAPEFYRSVFGWEVTDLGFARMIRRPGYGHHLASTVDPGIHERQSGAMVPPGFADAIGWVAPLGADEEPHWHVTFSVADRDDAATTAEGLGGSIVHSSTSDWTREAVVADPLGAQFTVSQFTPPG